MQEFDVVVIGAGINGLTTAAYLAKTGLKTAVIERRHVVGAHCSTEEVSIPGVRHNLHASALITPMSPCIDDLELERFGLELIGGEWALMHPFKDNRAFLSHAYDPNASYKMISRFSKRDAESFKKFINGVNKYITEIIDYFFTPPSEEAEQKFGQLVSKIPEVPPGLYDLNGYDVVNYLFEDEQVKTALVGFGLAITPRCREKYAGAIGVFSALTSSSGVQTAFTARGGSYNLPLSLEKCILSYGGEVLTNCEAERIIIEDGEAKAVKLSSRSAYPNALVKARRAIVSNLTAVPTFLHLVGEEHLDPRAVSALKKFDYTGQTLFTAVYATNEPLKWKAGEEWDRNVRESYWFHYGAESIKQLEDHERDIVEGRVSEPIVAVGGSFIFTVRDQSQAPPGMHNITTWVGVPYDLRNGGPEAWDQLKVKVEDKVTERIDEYARGFRKSILASAAYSPLEIFRRNPSAIGANFAGGNPKVGQFYMDRPFPGCGAPRTPIKKLYISNSIWPWSGTFLATGYMAACIVAEDLGVRNQPWWVNRPLGWFRKWVKQQSGKEWNPFITVG